jgi:hypothetical protein
MAAVLCVTVRDWRSSDVLPPGDMRKIGKLSERNGLAGGP